MNEPQQQKYVGFWLRFLAFLIDSILATAVIVPILSLFFGSTESLDLDVLLGSSTGEQVQYLMRETFSPTSTLQSLLQLVLSALAVILFWISRSATPGKMAIGAEIIDARTGGKPTTGQFIGRYFAYYISMLPLFLGFLWIAFDRRKQGWHDKLAGTVVVRKRH
ncbi:MAG: RDD family protein [Acidiferrobacteraceae bacterium]